MSESAQSFQPSAGHQPLFIAGPTAVGKSAFALNLAEQIGGEIISVDSMQVYRGLDIGTAKPTGEERARVPHHLLDVCDLTHAFDAAQFVQLAQTALREIQSGQRTPIFCGGTGFYFKAYLEGLGEAPASDHALRAEIIATPMETLLTELQQRDPETFEKIDRQNPRRVIRAIEVIRLTGKKFSDQKSQWNNHLPGHSIHPQKIICLTRPQTDLYARINARVDEMFAHGLVEETRQLLQHGLPENKFAMQAIGYRQVVEHLRGERDLARTIELVKSKTRKFAKRQLTWFRGQSHCEWIELASDENTVQAAANLLGRLRQTKSAGTIW